MRRDTDEESLSILATEGRSKGARLVVIRTCLHRSPRIRAKHGLGLDGKIIYLNGWLTFADDSKHPPGAQRKSFGFPPCLIYCFKNRGRGCSDYQSRD